MWDEILQIWRLHPGPAQPMALRLPIQIGRHPSCAIRLFEDDVSRFHACIESRDGEVCVIDQGSRNGVYLNGRRVGVAALEKGGIVRVGQSVFWLPKSEP